MKTTLTSLLMLAASPALLADITATATPATATPQAPTRIQGNCDLLASNTLRATYLGIREIQTQTFDQEMPSITQVAVFQVIENLAYRRYVRYGDGRLHPGAYFSVEMNRELPGQPSSIVDTIAQMQPGEEAVMKMDHLYIFGDQTGMPIRPCSRMARRQAAAAGQVQPTAVPQQEGTASYTAVSRRFSIHGNGATASTEVISQKLPGSDEVQTRMFINGQEVDPATRQPLNATPAPSAPPAQPSAETPAPQQQPAERSEGDVIVEDTPQPAAPAPGPCPAPTPQPAENENF